MTALRPARFSVLIAVCSSRCGRAGPPRQLGPDTDNFSRTVERQKKAQGASLGAIATKTGIPRTSLHRHLTPVVGAEGRR